MRILSIFLTVTVYRLALMEKRKTVISYNVKMKLKSSFHNIVPLTKKNYNDVFFSTSADTIFEIYYRYSNNQAA